ncbi:porin [Thioalkalivibrio thiocyanoxidans]|uniref:porin n=1 Tax=Thioalkalivibrio thiocyanoxidans TaxID=152475 RepID=UPI00037C3894|nr:porin [Thioalkalivibrio thiocyanoxidans]
MDQHPAWGKAALSAAVAIATVAGTGAIHADQGANSAPQFDFYGSLRTQGEYVRPDNRDESEDGLDAYWGVRDAYSRLGVHMDWALNDWIDLFGQVELPIDTANGKVQDPWDQDADVRVAQIGLRGDFGRVAYGQQWMPYYNAIASPLDMFSTYYSGFATFTSFRLGDTVSYYTPELGGFTFAGSYSRNRGALRVDGTPDDHYQAVAQYAVGDTTVAVGVDDQRGEKDLRLYGASISHVMGDLYLAAKYERFSSDIDEQAFGQDGSEAFNVFASYRWGPHVFKGMLAQVDHYGETIAHLGYDYLWTDNLKLFAEYYSEEETAAITERRAGAETFPAGASGGQVIAAGIRYDF